MTVSGEAPSRGTKPGRPCASHRSKASWTLVTWPAATIARATCGRPIDRPLAADVSKTRASTAIGTPSVGEPRTDGFDTRDPGRTLRKEKQSEHRVIGVDEVSEHVDVPLVVNRGDLDAVDGPNAVLAGDSANLHDSGDGVVVGHRHHRHACARRTLDQLSRRAATVGSGGVEMEIDRTLREERSPRRAGRGSPRPLRAPHMALALHQRLVFAHQQIQMFALFVGELEEDLLALGVLELLAIFLEEPVRAALAADADEQRLLVVDPLSAGARRLRRTARWRRP